MFVDPNDPNRVVFLGNWIPMEEPGGGPNFSNFGQNVRYEFEIDNDGDGQSDITYRFLFTRHVRNRGTFLYTTGGVTALNDENLNVYYTYTVDRLANHQELPTGWRRVGDGLVEAPPNIGPASFPEGYDAISAQSIYSLRTGEVVFAGPRADPFYVDLGSVFDLLNIPGRVPFPFNGHGQNGLAGFNVHTIALSVPIDRLTRNGTVPAGVNDPNAIISAWAATYRQTTSACSAATARPSRSGSGSRSRVWPTRSSTRSSSPSE